MNAESSHPSHTFGEQEAPSVYKCVCVCVCVCGGGGGGGGGVGVRVHVCVCGNNSKASCCPVSSNPTLLHSLRNTRSEVGT